MAHRLRTAVDSFPRDVWWEGRAVFLVSAHSETLLPRHRAAQGTEILSGHPAELMSVKGVLVPSYPSGLPSGLCFPMFGGRRLGVVVPGHR